MNALELVLLVIVLQHGHSARVGRDDELIHRGRWDAEGRNASHDAEHILVAYGRDSAFCAIGVLGDAMQEDVLTSSFEDLLIASLQSGDDIAKDGSRRCRGLFQRKRIESLGLLHIGHDGRGGGCCRKAKVFTTRKRLGSM
jgi:hypothetical protein